MDPPNGTPRSRPLLKFANRVYTASPQGTTNRFGSPSMSSSKRRAFDRAALPPSSLDRSRMDAASNIFRASTLGASTSSRFEPAIPSGTARKLFAPAATPEPRKTTQHRAIKTPGGTKLKASEKDLFEMRIASPPPELTGEALTRRLPADVDEHSSVYADQYAADLCPEGFTDEQKRQFFCILDLRRLKYAANEIFARKDWRVNVMNFAKEYEKSRSLIMLRYGLYEFKNVKPSEDVLRKWRLAHGLDVPAPSVTSPTTKRPEPPRGTKRKADDDSVARTAQPGALTASSANPNKRKLVEKESSQGAAAFSSAKATKPFVHGQPEPDENRPTPAPKPVAQPSTTKSLFEKIAGNANTPAKAKPSIFGSTLAPNPFAPTTKPSSNGATPRSVFDKTNGQSGNSANIFGYLSDAGSAQNSGVDADGESSTDSEQETENVAPSGGANTPNPMPAPPSLSNIKKIGPGGLATGPSSTSSEAKESSNSLSIFDRITKNNDGQPVRLQDEPVPAEPRAESSQDVPANKTWDPSTPLKFASAAPPAPTPGATSSSIFGQKPNFGASSLFPGAKSDKEGSPLPAPSSQQSSAETEKSAGESDKENSSQTAPGSLFGAPTFAPAAASSSALFKPVAEKKDDATPPLSAAASMFKAASEKKDTPAQPKVEDASSKASDSSAKSAFGSGASNIFGSAKQHTPNGTVMQSSTLFGNNSATSRASAPTEEPKSTLFGQKPAATDSAAETKPASASSLFAQKVTPSTFGSSTEGSKSNLFGPSAGTTTAPPSNLFGSAAASTSTTSTPNVFVSAPPSSEGETPKPSNLFGSNTSTGSSLFGQNKPALAGGPTFTFGSTPAKGPESAPMPVDSMFGSPMKQDGPSPGKRALGDAMQQDDASSPARKKQFGSSTPSSLFGNLNSTAAPQPPTTQPPTTQSSFTFGGFGTSTSNAAPMFGANPQAPKLDFNFGSSNNAAGPTPSFGGSSQPANGGFMFGGSGNTTPNPLPGQGANGGEPNPFAFNAATSAPQKGPGGRHIKKPNFGASKAAAQRAGLAGSPAPTAAPSQPAGNMFGNAAPPASSFTFGAPTGQPGSLFGNPQQQQPQQQQGQPQQSNLFGGLQPPRGGSSTTGTNSPFNFDGASSLATTPATGTPEPQTDPEAAGSRKADVPDGDAEPKQEQLNLTDGGPGEEDEEAVHEVRAKVLKFVSPTEADGNDKGAASKSPWKTEGVGPLRLLKHKTTKQVRMLLRKEPAGVVALNRLILPNFNYKAEKKYVKVTTSSGSGLETWMVQVKTEDLAKQLAEALEANKAANKT